MRAARELTANFGTSGAGEGGLADQSKWDSSVADGYLIRYSRKAMASMNAAAGLLARGLGLLIFPEGTRSMDYSKLQEFKTGGMIVALTCKAMVAPVIITGSGGLLPKHGRRLAPGRVTVRVLPPFDPAASYTLKDREAFKNDLWALMDRAYQEMRP